jgi:threonine dehydratase
MFEPEHAVAAEERIRPHVRLTPVQRSVPLEGGGGTEVHLKLENHQATGSFKLRGAFNKMLLIDKDQRARGVVAASTGNHGAAVARAARELGAPATIFVPTTADPTKLASIVNDGAVIVEAGGDCVESELAARHHADESGLLYVSPYNDPDVVAGQGSIGVELEQQLGSIDAVFIALGGGGLISGVGSYLKSVFPSIDVCACSPENSAVMHHSLEAGRLLEMDSAPTLSDGTAGGVEKGSITFDLCRSVVDRSILVTEREIADAMRGLIADQHLLVEGAAAVAVAGFLKQREDHRGRRVAIILCGSNVSSKVLCEVLS